MLQQADVETCSPTLPEAQPSPVKHGTFCAEPVLVDRPGLLYYTHSDDNTLWDSTAM